MREILTKIITESVSAPSGENCQPWSFRISETALQVHNLPDVDQSLYNFQQKGSLVAHGALLENICICARAKGLVPEVWAFPDPTDKNYVAEIRFTPGAVMADPLYEAMAERTTNRKLYDTSPLTAEQVAELKKAQSAIGAGTLFITTDREDIATLASAASVNERLIFENEELHKFFFSHIRWDESENKKNPRGFYLKTLELSPQEQKGFRLFKYWPIVRLFKLFGLPKKVAAANCQKYAGSGAVGVIVAESDEPLDLLMAGRLMERLWLRVTKLGLSLQPTTGLLFLMQKIFAGQTKELSSDQIQLITGAYNTIQTVFGVANPKQKIIMMFRIGRGGQPSARASRIDPIVY